MTNIRGLITINNPVALPTLNPVGIGCTLTASGTVNPPAVELREIWIRINGNVMSKAQTSLNWSFINAGPCNLAAQNIIEVKIRYIHETLGEQTSGFDACREFVCSGSNYTCYNYAMGPYYCPERMTSQGGVLRQVLPRYYRMSVHSLGASSGENFYASFGGLLQRNSIYLCYDAEASFADEAVWRNRDLPEAMGRWTLRVCSTGAGYAAHLSRQRLSESQVLPPLVYYASAFHPISRNLVTSLGGCCGEHEPLAGAVLEIEPA